MAAPTHRRPRPTRRVTERDLWLIDALHDAPRGSWEAIATLLGDGATRVTAARRWNALVAGRVAWQVAYPGPRWWLHHQLAWASAALPQLQGVVNEIAADGRILSLDVAPGEILAAFGATDHAHAARLVHEGRLGVSTHSIDLAVHLYSSASKWRVGALPGPYPAADTASGGSPPPDDRIRSLLAVLGPDPRAPIAAVAARCGVGETTARRWVDHAIAGGDLAVRVEVAPDAAARPLAIHWWIRAADPDRVARTLIEQRDVRWVAAVVSTTGATLLAAAWARDPRGVHRLVSRIAGQHPDATTVRQSMTMRPVKRLGWRVDEDGRRLNYVPLVI